MQELPNNIPRNKVISPVIRVIESVIRLPGRPGQAVLLHRTKNSVTEYKTENIPEKTNTKYI